MSWPVQVSAADVMTRSLVVLDGTIVKSYQDFIPGVRPRIVGTHWLFDRSPKIVRATHLGEAIIRVFPDIGFWTLPGEFSISLGTNIQASLVRHQNTEGYITLMPYPCSKDSLLELKYGKSLFYDHGQPIKDLPITFRDNFVIGEPDPADQLTVPFAGAMAILRTATSKLALQWDTVVNGSGGEPCHYFANFVDNIPPRSPGDPEPISRTFFPPDRAPQRGGFPPYVV